MRSSMGGAPSAPSAPHGNPHVVASGWSTIRVTRVDAIAADPDVVPDRWLVSAEIHLGAFDPADVYVLALSGDGDDGLPLSHLPTAWLRPLRQLGPGAWGFEGIVELTGPFTLAILPRNEDDAWPDLPVRIHGLPLTREAFGH